MKHHFFKLLAIVTSICCSTHPWKRAAVIEETMDDFRQIAYEQACLNAQVNSSDEHVNYPTGVHYYPLSGAAQTLLKKHNLAMQNFHSCPNRFDAKLLHEELIRIIHHSCELADFVIKTEFVKTVDAVNSYVIPAVDIARQHNVAHNTARGWDIAGWCSKALSCTEALLIGAGIGCCADMKCAELLSHRTNPISLHIRSETPPNPQRHHTPKITGPAPAGHGTPATPSTNLAEGKGNFIKVFEQKKINDFKEHIFSEDHRRRGILGLGDNREAIMEHFVSTIWEADKRNLLKEGSNQLECLFNNKEATIRLFIENQTVLSINLFAGRSSRILGNRVTIELV